MFNLLKSEGNSEVFNKDNEISNLLKNHNIEESEKNNILNNVKNSHITNSDLVNDTNKINSQINRNSCAFNA